MNNPLVVCFCNETINFDQFAENYHVLSKNVRFAQITQKNAQKYNALHAQKMCKSLQKIFVRKNYSTLAQQYMLVSWKP